MDQAEWQVKATSCELLALSLRYPDVQLAQVVASGEWLDAACELARAARVALPESFGTQVLALDGAGQEVVDEEALLHTLRAEATFLFVGAPNPACSPYESVWRAAAEGVRPLLFVSPHSMEVERFCKSCGLGSPEGTNEPFDYVVTELELLQYLASLAAGIVVPPEGGIALDALPDGSSQAAFAQFAEEHVLAWMPDFAERLASESRLPFYRAVAELLAAMLTFM